MMRPAAQTLRASACGMLLLALAGCGGGSSVAEHQPDGFRLPDAVDIATCSRGPGPVRVERKAPIAGEGRCGIDVPVRAFEVLTSPPARIEPPVTVNCGITNATAWWLAHVVQPAAARHYGEPVVAMTTMGGYACRRINNRPNGDLSQHAFGNAIDVAGIVLASGHRVTVKRDWRGGGADAAFLREIHRGACQGFSVVLGPEYNRAHHDHFHFDLKPRKAGRKSYCK